MRKFNKISAKHIGSCANFTQLNLRQLATELS